jgi:hypothetical protein
MTTPTVASAQREIESINRAITEAVGQTANSAMLRSVLASLQLLMLDDAKRSNSEPNSQLYRLLQGFHLAGKISESCFYELTSRYGTVHQQLDGMKA